MGRQDMLELRLGHVQESLANAFKTGSLQIYIFWYSFKQSLNTKQRRHFWDYHHVLNTN